MISLKFYVPRHYVDIEEVREIRSLLDRIGSSSEIDIIELVIDEKAEENLKSQVLLGISVFKRIGIKQTRRTKMLYPQLVVLVNNEPETFYPQKRAGQSISIQEFLEGLLNNEVRCLHDKGKVEDELGRDELV